MLNEIPKKIHIIWFGDKSKLKFDLDSLKKFAPRYEVKVWGEEDFDWDELCKIPYVKKTYTSQSWAFLSDYIRAKILYEEGGVYLDADMKVLKFIEGMFSGKSLVLAFENNTTLSMGFAASCKGHQFFKDLMSIYESTTTGKTIMGNVIWDFLARRDLGIKINGKYQESHDYVIYEFRRVSLIHQRYRYWKRENQYLLHQHTVSWVPKWARPGLKMVIAITQKLTFINKLYIFLLIWPTREMKRHYKMLDENGERILIKSEALRLKRESKKRRRNK